MSNELIEWAIEASIDELDKEVDKEVVSKGFATSDQLNTFSKEGKVAIYKIGIEKKKLTNHFVEKFKTPPITMPSTKTLNASIFNLKPAKLDISELIVDFMRTIDMRTSINAYGNKEKDKRITDVEQALRTMNFPLTERNLQSFQASKIILKAFPNSHNKFTGLQLGTVLELFQKYSHESLIFKPNHQALSEINSKFGKTRKNKSFKDRLKVYKNIYLNMYLSKPEYFGSAI